MTTTKDPTTEPSAVSTVRSDHVSGDVQIRFLGTAAFEIVTANNVRLIIDPFLEENTVSPVKVADLEDLDLVLVTHAAYDHMGDTLEIMRTWPDVLCVAGVDVRGYLMAEGIPGDRIWSSPWGMMIAVAGVTIRPVYSRHWSYIQGSDGTPYSSIPIAYIVHASDSCRIYHSGDTALFSDMKLLGELYQPTIGLINVGVPGNHVGAKHGVPEYLSGEMDGKEAAMAVDWLKLDTVIPCHHDDITLPEVVDFTNRVQNAGKTKVELLNPGEHLHVAN